MFDLQRDIDALSKKLAELANVAAVVIDPISAYLGEKCDSHKNAEVRAVLAPLAAMIAERKVALAGISHLSKAGSTQALLRIIGSLAFVATARAAYLVAADPQDKVRRFFLPIKNNLSPDSSGLAFRIEGVTIPSPYGSIETARIAWEQDPVTITADEAIRPPEPAADTVLGQAIGWLLSTLREPSEAKEIYANAAKMGISQITVRRAAKNLYVRKRKGGPEGRWVWSLPDGQDDQGAQGAQDYQGRKDDHLAGDKGQDAYSATSHDHLDHVDHLRSSKGLKGQNKVINGHPDDHLAPANDDDYTEVEL
jgi:hypothetical protein